MLKRTFIFLIIILLSSLFSYEVEDKAENKIQFKIKFLKIRPYNKTFFFFRNKHLEIVMEIKNVSDTTYIIEKFTPSGVDGNPELILRNAKTKQNVRIVNKDCWLYLWSDSFYVSLKPNEVYRDTIDFEEIYDFDFRPGDRYELYLIYQPRVPYEELIKKFKFPLWRKPLQSNKLTFIY